MTNILYLDVDVYSLRDTTVVVSIFMFAIKYDVR